MEDKQESTHLEDGHDGGREGVKVGGCVVLEDEPVKKTQERKQTDQYPLQAMVLLCVGLRPFKGQVQKSLSFSRVTAGGKLPKRV